jgi:hypothetical protein
MMAANCGLGVTAFMNAALGDRFAAGAAAFLATAFFTAAAFFAGAAFLAGAFFAVAMSVISIK